MARSFYVILSIFFLSFYYVSGALFWCLVPFTHFNKIIVGGHTTPLLFRPKHAHVQRLPVGTTTVPLTPFPDSNARGGVWG